MIDEYTNAIKGIIRILKEIFKVELHTRIDSIETSDTPIEIIMSILVFMDVESRGELLKRISYILELISKGSFYNRMKKEIDTKTSLFKTWGGTTSLGHVYPKNFFERSLKTLSAPLSSSSSSSSSSSAASPTSSLINPANIRLGMNRRLLSEDQLSRGIYGPKEFVPEMSISFENEEKFAEDGSPQILLMGVYDLPLSVEFANTVYDARKNKKMKATDFTKQDELLFKNTNNKRSDLVGNSAFLSDIIARMGEIPVVNGISKKRFIFVNACRQISCSESNRPTRTILQRVSSVSKRNNAPENVKQLGVFTRRALQMNNYGTLSEENMTLARSFLPPVKSFPENVKVFVELKILGKIYIIDGDLIGGIKFNKHGFFYEVQYVDPFTRRGVRKYLSPNVLFPYVEWKKGDWVEIFGSNKCNDGTKGVILEILKKDDPESNLGSLFMIRFDGSGTKEKISKNLLRKMEQTWKVGDCFEIFGNSKPERNGKQGRISDLLEDDPVGSQGGIRVKVEIYMGKGETVKGSLLRSQLMKYRVGASCT